MANGLPAQQNDRLTELLAEQANRSSVEAPQESDGGGIAVSVATAQAARRFTDNLLGLPEDAGRLLAWLGAAPPAAIEAGLAAFQGQPAEFGRRLDEKASAGRNQFPASALIGAGQLNTGQIAADLRAINTPLDGRGLPEMRGDELARQQEADSALLEQHPIASTVGNVAGDVGTVLAGRAPFRDQLRNFASPGRPKVTAPPGIRREFQRIKAKPIFRDLNKGVRRAAETGVEGAAVAMLNDGDPVTTAALAAGAQSAGSLSLWLASKPVRRFAPAVIASTLGVQLFRQAAPGVQQNIFESLDLANTKILAVAATAVLAGMTGMARLPKQTQENLGIFGDSLAPAMRVPLLRVFSSLTEEAERGEDTTLRVMDKISSDPDYFSPTQLNRIQRAMRSEKGSLSGEIKQMVDGSQNFRELVDALHEARQ